MILLNRFSLLVVAMMIGTNAGKAADWKLLESSKKGTAPALITKVASSPAGKRVTLNLCLFSTNDFTLRVVDQGSDQADRKYTNLREAMEKNGCAAGVNGGFYGTDFKALGVVYENGKRISPYVNSNRNGLATGVIWSGVGGIHIVRRAEFKGGAGVEQAIQTGPMLISNATTVAGLSDSRPRPRSFVLTDWKGKWMIGTSSYLTLKELSEVLDSSKVMTELTVNRAINLDGGRSTGFYLKQANGQVTYRAEISKVRNFLGIVPKK